MPKSSLLDETRSMLASSEKTLPEISNLADVNLHWLRKFQQGKFDDPGVRKIQKLHTFLSSAN